MIDGYTGHHELARICATMRESDIEIKNKVGDDYYIFTGTLSGQPLVIVYNEVNGDFTAYDDVRNFLCTQKSEDRIGEAWFDALLSIFYTRPNSTD